MISTGAPMPPGDGWVVRAETGKVCEAGLETDASARTGADVRPRGSDFKVGQRLAGSGRRLDHFDLARISAGGIARLSVAGRPSVALFGLGDELASVTAARRPDQIFDALTLPIAVRLRQAGALIEAPKILPDDRKMVSGAIAGMPNIEIFVLIGGASKGRHDHARRAVHDLGFTSIVPSVAMRPGKPFWAAMSKQGQIIVGLPGNPVAALAAVELFALPLIHTWQGSAVRQAIDIDCPTSLANNGTLEKLIFARWQVGSDGRFEVEPLGGVDSAAHHPIAGADLLLIIPRGAGSRARAIPLC